MGRLSALTGYLLCQKTTHAYIAGCPLVVNHSHGQQEPSTATDNVHAQAQMECFLKRQPPVRDQTQQEGFANPYQRLANSEGSEVGHSGRDEHHEAPENWLRDQVSQDYVRQPVSDAEPCRDGIGEYDEAFNHDSEREGQREGPSDKKRDGRR